MRGDDTTGVVFLHGAGTGARAEDAALAASLDRHLGATHDVVLPRLPEDDPVEAHWLRAIDDAVAAATAPIVLVGHSMGGYLLLKHLSTRRPSIRIVAVCVIAAPFPGADPAWTFEGFELPDDLDRLLPAETPVLLYASEDDEVVPFAHRDRYAAAIPRAIVRTTSGGHQLSGDLRVVADDIRALRS